MRVKCWRYGDTEERNLFLKRYYVLSILRCKIIVIIDNGILFFIVFIIFNILAFFVIIFDVFIYISIVMISALNYAPT